MARTNSTGTLAFTSANSLANSTTSVAASSAVRVTPTTENIIDTQVVVTVSVGAITPSTSTYIPIWLYGSVDGTTFAGGQTSGTEYLGSDAAVTLSSYGNNLVRVGLIRCHSASKVYKSEPISVAQAFGGVVPSAWGVVIQNQSGLALAASGHSIDFNEISLA